MGTNRKKEGVSSALVCFVRHYCTATATTVVVVVAKRRKASSSEGEKKEEEVVSQTTFELNTKSLRFDRIFHLKTEKSL